MSKYINIKTLIVFILLMLSAVFVAYKVDAGSSSLNWDFQCSRHGQNDWKICEDGKSFLRSDYYAAAISGQFLGHRHGNSDIYARVCVYSGGNGQCQWWSCPGPGGNCGYEYGNQHPWNLLTDYSMTVWGNGGANVSYYARVTDAEVRIVGTGTADYVDPIYGCTDPAAINYNPSANTNDGSCQYPYFVNLNFYVKNQLGQSITGASVNISQDFGNGTNRSTDGNGFANFGVHNNKNIGWSASASSCSSFSGSVNSGSSGATVNVSLSCTIQCSGSSSQGCPSNPNACGQTSSGTQTRTCDTSTGNWGGWSSCSASTPSNPPGYGTACTGATSPQNACGQTNPGGAGTIQCDGSCSGATGTTPTNPAGYGTACNPTNVCGQSNSGTIQCDGSCSVSAPAVTIPGGNTYGAACSSVANACGQTQSNGTWQCDGSCSSTPPANTCSSTAIISASPNPIIYNTSSVLTWSSTNTVANSCSITGGPVVGSSTSLPTSGSKSTANLTANTTYTVSCVGFNGSSVSDSTTVSVGAAPVMNYFRCNGVNTPGTCTIGYGGTAAITWSSSNTTNCSLVSTLPSDEGVGLSGTNNYAGITSNRDYSIECWNDTSGVHAPALPLPLRVVVSGPSVDIKANNSNGPITLAWNSSANLSWTSSNAGSCNASGDWSGSKALNDSESTGNLTNPKTYNYTLTCSGNGSASDTVQVILNSPVPNNPANVTVTQPDYCLSGPAATVNWIYSDPSGSPQSAYQVQMDEQGSFQSPEYDSCVNQNTCASGNSSNSNFTGQGILQFNKTYKTRVRVWNGYGVVSGWTVVSGNHNTPPYAYPQTDFYWTANGLQNNPSPPLNKPVTFTDQTVFNGNPNGREWSWVFGDGGSSTTQNPSHTYPTEGSYYVTLTATDNANQSCARTKGPLFIQKPIPKWREVAPR